MGMWVEPNFGLTTITEFHHESFYAQIPLTAMWMDNQESMILAVHPELGNNDEEIL